MEHGIGPDLVEQLALAGDHAQGGVVVAGDALGRRVQREVDAVRQRPLPERGGEGRVDDGHGALDRPDLLEVDDAEAALR